MHLHSLLDQRVIVLTASRRTAHALRLDYARHAEAQGLTAWQTPRILPWSAWLRQQWIESRAASSSDRYVRLLTSTQARAIWSEVVAQSPAGAALLNPANAAKLAAASFKRMQDYSIALESLRNADSVEAQALYGWCRDFLQRCEELRAIDEARLTGWALESGFVPSEPVALVGFDHIVPAVSRLIERWRAQDKLREVLPSAEGEASVVTVGVRDGEAEIELAARWARAQLEGGRSRIGILLRDLQRRRAEVTRVFADVFAPGLRATVAEAHSLPVTIAAPQPLASYALVDAAALILELVTPECSSTHVGRILRSPFLKGGDSERDRRAMADLKLRAEQRDRWNWFELERWAGAYGCEELAQVARRMTQLARSETGHAKPSKWSERFHGWLRAAGWPGDRSLNSVEHQTVAKFQAALAELGTLDAVLPAISLRMALARLRDLLRETPFEPETQASAVTVIDPTTVAGMTFEAVWVAGLDATSLPGPISPDPLLPLEVQRKAGIPEASAETLMQQARTQLRRWTSSAPEVVLSWPEQDEEAVLQPSPLIAHWPRSTPDRIARAGVASLQETLFEKRPVLEEVEDEIAPALPPGAARGGARTIELQSRCPFRAQAELRLRAEVLPSVSLGVEPRDRGTLLHQVLGEIWGSLGSHRALIEQDRATLIEKVREVAERRAVSQLAPTTASRAKLVSLAVDSVVEQVSRLLELEKERFPFALAGTETAESFVIGGLEVTLRPDRVDSLEAGGQMLIDYKLGDSHSQRHWLDFRPGRPLQPQLPLYGLAHSESLRALAFVVLAPGTVEYRGWSDGTKIGANVLPYPAGIRLKPGDPPDWKALVEHWRATLTRLAEQYVSGYAAVDPLPVECRGCHLSTLCRIHELKAREEGATEDE
ncbi:MAG TPA: PD-(D/E)XK nuclease family protein [Steroidobacter sp.]